MKQGRKPTRNEKFLLSAVGKDWTEYQHLETDTDAKIITFISKRTNEKIQVLIANPRKPELLS